MARGVTNPLAAGRQTSDYTARPPGQFEIATFYVLYNASVTPTTTRRTRVAQDVVFFKPHNKMCATHINICGLNVDCPIAVVCYQKLTMRDSNNRPTDCKADALATKLEGHGFETVVGFKC
jgi:hypothetical protein